MKFVSVRDFIQYDGSNLAAIKSALEASGAYPRSFVYTEVGNVLSINTFDLAGVVELNTGDWIEPYAFNIVQNDYFQKNFVPLSSVSNS